MADQAVMQLSLNVSSTNFEDTKSFDYTDTLSKQGLVHGIQTVTTDYAAMTIDSLASTDQGILVLNNLDPNNYVLYGSTLGEFKLPAGEFAAMKLNAGITIQVKAPTANVKIEKYLLSE